MAAEGAATKAKTSEITFARRMWRDYSLSITVFALFAVSFVLHTIFGWLQYVADQTSQGQTPTLTRHRRRGVMETTWLDAGFSRRRSSRRA
jgi:uncharacterized protein DUF6766